MRAKIDNNATIEYDETGQGSPVVLLHAFPLSRAMWRPQVEALSDDYRIITPDLRGFGGSSPFDGEPSIERMADDIAALLDYLGISEPVVLGGLSMGGYVALNFVRKYPQRLRALILADTRAEPDTAEGKAKRNEMIQLAETEHAAGIIEKMLPNLTGATTRESRADVVNEVKRIATAQSDAGIINGLRALRDRADAEPWLNNIDVPALIVFGEEDTITPLSMAEKLRDNIRQSQLVTIPAAGHLSNLEQPKLFTAAVRQFLQEIV